MATSSASCVTTSLRARRTEYLQHPHARVVCTELALPRSMDTWNRQQLWAEHDAAHLRGLRLRSFVLVVGLLTAWNVIAVLGHSFDLCLTDANVDPPRKIAEPAECVVDDDCVLVPELMTCCGECDAVPPLEAAPWAMVDEIRRDAEESCAPRDRLCEPPICPSAPADCEAHPICRAGQCAVEANDRCIPNQGAE